MFAATQAAPGPPGVTHTAPMQLSPCAHGINVVHALVADEGGWHVPALAQSRLPPQSDDVVHGAPVAPSATQLPQLEPLAIRQYPVPHWAP